MKIRNTFPLWQTKFLNISGTSTLTFLKQSTVINIRDEVNSQWPMLTPAVSKFLKTLPIYLTPFLQ